MIPEQYKEQVIVNGVQFIRTITAAYGADEGIKLWETISAVLDPDIKGQIFFAMLTGGDNHRVIRIKGLNSFYTRDSKVPLIKLIREIAGLGLKEAKDAVELLEVNTAVTITRYENVSRAHAINQLLAMGCDV